MSEYGLFSGPHFNEFGLKLFILYFSVFSPNEENMDQKKLELNHFSLSGILHLPEATFHGRLRKKLT